MLPEAVSLSTTLPPKVHVVSRETAWTREAARSPGGRWGLTPRSPARSGSSTWDVGNTWESLFCLSVVFPGWPKAASPPGGIYDDDGVFQTLSWSLIVPRGASSCSICSLSACAIGLGGSPQCLDRASALSRQGRAQGQMHQHHHAHHSVNRRAPTTLPSSAPRTASSGH